MSEYHVRRGLAGIYAGSFKKSGDEWQSKSDVTNEAIREVAMYLLENGLELRFSDGKDFYTLSVSRLAEGVDHSCRE